MAYLNKINIFDRNTLKRALCLHGQILSPIKQNEEIFFVIISSFCLIFYTFFAEKVINLASAAHNRKLIFHYITLKICILHTKSKLSTLKRA